MKIDNKFNSKIKSSLLYLTLLIYFLIFNQCKKVDLPNDQSKLLIGHWLIKTQKGTVGTSNPSGVASNLDDFKDIIFKSNGNYRETKIIINDGSFKIVTGISTKTGKEANIIKYSKKGDQSFRISNDSLYLIDEYGPWTWIYKKK